MFKLYSFTFIINDPATTEIYTLSLHDALPIWLRSFAASWLLNALLRIFAMSIITPKRKVLRMSVQDCWRPPLGNLEHSSDRKSGSAGMPRPISYAVLCLNKKMNAINFKKDIPPLSHHNP